MGVTEGVHAAVGPHEVVPATVARRGHADDGRRGRAGAQGAEEACSVVGVHAAIGADQPVAARGVLAMPTTGALRWRLAPEPWKVAAPKVKTPASAAPSQ